MGEDYSQLGFTPAPAAAPQATNAYADLGFTPSQPAQQDPKAAHSSVGKFMGEIWNQTGGQIGATVKRVSGWDDWMKIRDQMKAGDYSGAGQTMMDMTKDPGHLGGDILANSKDQVQRAGKALKEGRYSDAALHINAAIPVVGTAFASGVNGLDKMAEGNHAEGAADVVANLGMLALPGAVEEAGSRAVPKVRAHLERVAPVVKAAVQAGAPDIAMGALKAGAGAGMDAVGVPGHVSTILGAGSAIPDFARAVKKGFKAGRQVITDRQTPPALPAEPPALPPEARLVEGSQGRQPGIQDPAAVEPMLPRTDTGVELTPEQEANIRARNAQPAEQAPTAPTPAAAAPEPAAAPAEPAPVANPYANLGFTPASANGADNISTESKPASATPAGTSADVPPEPTPIIPENMQQAAEVNNPAAAEAPPGQGITPEVNDGAAPGSAPGAAVQPAVSQRPLLDEPAYERPEQANQKPDYQAAARTVKGRALARFLSNPPEGPAITAEEATRMTPEQWQLVAREAGLAAKTPPSIETQKLAIEHLQEIEARRAQRTLGSSTSDTGGPAAAGATIPDDGGSQAAPQPIETPNPGEGSQGLPAQTATAPSNQPGQGIATDVEIPGEGRSYPARYKLRELADVQPSHNGLTFQPNPRYGLVNDRNYATPENQGKVLQGSGAKFKPGFHITDNPDASNGPPIVDQAGNAIGGNGRTMQLQRVYAYNPEGAAAYRNTLTAKAAQFGIDPAELAGMKQPVLVREIAKADLEKPAHAVTDFNKTGTASLTPSERAIADSRRVSIGTLDDINRRLQAAGDEATLGHVLATPGQGAEILQRLVDDGVITDQEKAGLVSGDKLTAAGRQRISKLMLGRFFRDPAQLDTVPGQVIPKLERIAAPIAKLEDSGAWNLMPKLQEALDLIDEMKAYGRQDMGEFLKQTGLLGESRYTQDAIGLAKTLTRVSGRRIAAAVTEYQAAERAAAEHASAKAGLFADQVTEPAPKGAAQAFDDAFRPGGKPLAPPARSLAKKVGDQVKKLAKDTEGALKSKTKSSPPSPLQNMFDSLGADPEYQSRIDADRATAELAQKSRRQVDAGKESIEDSPLFGGPRQQGLF